MKRTLNYTLPLILAGTLLFTSCDKDKEEEQTPTTPVETESDGITIDADYQATGKLDGVSISYIDGKDQYRVVPSFRNTGGGMPGPDSVKAFYMSTIASLDKVDGFLLAKGTRKFMFHQQFIKSQFLSFFAKGTYGITSENLDTYSENGMELIYVDPAGKEWASYGGPQTGSFVKIKETKDISRMDDDLYSKSLGIIKSYKR